MVALSACGHRTRRRGMIACHCSKRNRDVRIAGDRFVQATHGRRLMNQLRAGSLPAYRRRRRDHLLMQDAGTGKSKCGVVRTFVAESAASTRSPRLSSDRKACSGEGGSSPADVRSAGPVGHTQAIVRPDGRTDLVHEIAAQRATERKSRSTNAHGGRPAVATYRTAHGEIRPVQGCRNIRQHRPTQMCDAPAYLRAWRLRMSVRFGVVVLCGVFVSACSGSRAKSTETNGLSIRPTWPGPGANGNGCPVDEVTWTTTKAGFDSAQTLQLVTKLEAAAKSDLEAVKGNAQAGASFGLGLQNAIKDAVQREFKVSQDVTELSVVMRDLECAILRGTFQTKRDAAEQQLLDLIAGYGKKKTELQSAEQ